MRIFLNVTVGGEKRGEGGDGDVPEVHDATPSVSSCATILELDYCNRRRRLRRLG
jgi:hypothetical protein